MNITIRPYINFKAVDINGVNLPTKPVAMLEGDCFSYSCEKQKLKPKLFYIRMFDYPKNKDWAQKMVVLTANTSRLIEKKIDFNNLLEYIEKNISIINGEDFACLKTKRQNGFQIGKKKRGAEYYKKYYKKINLSGQNFFIPKTNSKYKNANTCMIKKDDSKNTIKILYGYCPNNNFSNLDIIKNVYNDLLDIENPALGQIYEASATINWLLAQESPYKRGNDSIASVLTKSILRAYDVEIFPVKKGKSLDFEAFYRDLDEYIEKYPGFFEKE